VPGGLRILHAYFRRVIGLVGALVDQSVGGNVHHRALEARYTTLIVGKQVHLGLQARIDHIDVLRPEARSHDQSILTGHQVEQRRTGRDHAAGRMNPQVGDDAVLGRLDLGSGQLILGGKQFLAQLKYLVLCLAQRLGDLVLPVVLQLEQIRSRLADDLLGTRNLRANLSPPPLDVSRFPLKVQKARAPLKALFDEIGNCRYFIAYDSEAL